MQYYGNFEVSRKIGSGLGTVVYAARVRSAQGPEDHAVKVFSPQLGSLEAEAGEAPAPAHVAFLEDAQARIEIQNRAAGGSPFIAPILEQGRDESSLWYATRRYPQSLERILRERTRLSSAQVVHLLLCAVRGALALKKACGRSHGNLKSTNLLAASTGRLQTATVVITDPLSGGADQADACELADLKAIGQMLYEIVRRKEVAAQDWEDLLLPLELTDEWSATFGKDASRWLALCNRLLDRQLRLSECDLSRLEKELEKLKPKTVVSTVAVAAVLLVAGLGGLSAWWLTRPSNAVALTLNSDPPGATLLLNGQAVGTTPWNRKVAAGEVSVVASNDLGTLTNTLVGGGKGTNYTFHFPYGRAVITSDPAGATVEDANGHSVGTTPFVSSRIKPGQYSYLLRLANHHPAAINVVVPTDGGTNRAPMVALRRITGPNVSVMIKVEPRDLGQGAVITNLTTRQSGNGSPSMFDLKPGPSRFELLLPAPWPNSAFEVVVGTNADQEFVQRLPASQVDFDSVPPGAAVWAGTNLVGVTPTNRLWPTGAYTFEWRLPYHATNRFETNLLDGSALQRRETLEELLSPVRLVANLNGARVYATNAELGRFGGWLVGTSGTNVGLPGTNTLIAEFADEQLGPLPAVVVTNAMAQRNSTNEYRFDFDYGMVSLQPPAGSTVSVGGHALTARPVRRYQRPGDAVTYAIVAPHFSPTNITLAVNKGETVSRHVELLPALYDVFLKVVPPVAQARLLSSGLALANGLNRLPWGAGRYEVVATYPRLGSVTNSIVMNEQGVTQSLSLAYARLSVTTKQRGLRVLEGNDELGFTPVDVYLPPGSHTFTFASGSGSTNWSTNLLEGASETLSLPFQFTPDYLTNSVGVRLAYVTEAGVFVGQFELTRGQYAAVLPLPTRTEAYCNTPNCPVIFVSWANALDFCAKLTSREQEQAYLKAQGLDGWSYSLPRESDWSSFAPDGELAGEPDAVFRNSGFSSPQPVSDARKSFNRYNLYDLYGNVAEFCIGNGGAPLLMGGSFLTTKSQLRLEGPTVQNAVNGYAYDAGFRVVLKHSGH